MKKTLKYIAVIALGMILAYIPFRDVLSGGFLNPIDINFYFDPERNLYENLFIWRDGNNGIFNPIFHILGLPLSILTHGLYKIGLNAATINKLWYFLPLFFLFISTFVFSRTLIGLNEKIDKKNEHIKTFVLPVIIAALFIVSKHVAFDVIFGWPVKSCMVLGANFLLISHFLKYVKYNSRANLVYAALLSILAVGLIQHFVFANIFIVIISLFLAEKKDLLPLVKKYLLFLMAVLLVNIWWILIYLYAAKVNFSYYSIDIVKQVKEGGTFNSFARTLLLENNIPPRPFHVHYLKFNLEVLYYVLLWMGSFSILLFKKAKKKMFFGLITLSLIYLFFASGNASPLKDLYIMMIEKVPSAEMFRNIMKVNGFLFFVVLFGAIYSGSKILIDLKKSKGRIFTTFIVVISFIAIGIVPGYLSGNMNGALKEFNLPNEYYETDSYLSQTKENGSVLVLPLTDWFSEFTWHDDLNHIHNPIRTLLKNPVIYDEFHNSNINEVQKSLVEKIITYSLGPEGPEPEEVSTVLATDMIPNISSRQDIELFTKLNDLDVEYILLQKDNLRPFEGLDKEETDKVLYNFKERFKEHLKPVVETENIALYKVTANEERSKTPHIYSEEGEGVKLEFKKINPTKYRVSIHNAKEPFNLILKENFHKGWKTYMPKPQTREKDLANLIENYKLLNNNRYSQASKSELEEMVKEGHLSTLGDLKKTKAAHEKWEGNRKIPEYEEVYVIDYVSKNFNSAVQNNNLKSGYFYETWLRAPIFSEDSHNQKGYANRWNIDASVLCIQGAPCIKNQDGTYDFDLIIEFWPQRIFYIGLIISLLSLLLGIGYLTYGCIRKNEALLKKLKHFN